MKKILVATLAITTVAMAAYASSLGGSKADPVLTETKLNSILNNNITLSVLDGYNYYEESTIVAELVGDQLNIVNCLQNDIVTVEPGAKIVLIGGTVTLSGEGKLIDASDAREINNPYSLQINKPYIVTEDSMFDITMTSSSGTILVVGEYDHYNPYETKYDKYAQALHSLGLFMGTTTGYQLDREATRMEAAIMLVRLMGEEKIALEGEYKPTFLDIPSWAEDVAGFAQAQGYIAGYSSTRFGAYEKASINEYFAFLLRALGYEDNVDFVWTESEQFAKDIGLISYSPDYFYRDFIAYASFNALTQVLNGGEMTLAQKLIEDGIMTQEEYENAKEIVNRTF